MVNFLVFITSLVMLIYSFIYPERAESLLGNKADAIELWLIRGIFFTLIVIFGVDKYKKMGGKGSKRAKRKR